MFNKIIVSLIITVMLFSLAPAAPVAQAASVADGSTTSACNAAELVKEVTFAGGTKLAPRAEFVKFWLIKNVGTCTWEPTYKLVFTEGERFEGIYRMSILRKIEPGQTITLMVRFKAPAKTGDYTGYFKLQDKDGNSFGIGSDFQQPLSVSIKVSRSEEMVYNMAAKYCDAKWRSQMEGSLVCPATTAEPAKGYIMRLDKPKLEDGSEDNEPALLVYPNDTKNGWTEGVFPAIKIQAGYQFRAVIGCQYQSKDCNVKFKLNAIFEDGSQRTLWSWDETDNGKYRHVAVDLTPLAGRKVQLVLKVINNGTAKDSYALWLMPRVVK